MIYLLLVQWFHLRRSNWMIIVGLMPNSADPVLEAESAVPLRRVPVLRSRSGVASTNAWWVGSGSALNTIETL